MDRYSDLPLTVYAFHGCDAEIAERVFAGETDLVQSTNKYDWLGSGVYFWENAPARALKWAQDAQKRHPDRIRRPAVVGALVNLGRCLNLMDKDSNLVLSETYSQIQDVLSAERSNGHAVNMPSNHGKSHDLDALVINISHEIAAKVKGRAFDTVRAAFIEGNPVFPGSSIMSDTHIQICVRDPAKSVVAYFRPRLAF